MINIISRQLCPEKPIMNKNSCKLNVANNNLSPLKADTTSFTGITEIKKIAFSELSKEDFPDRFYLRAGSILSRLKWIQGQSLMEDLPMDVGDLMARRMNFLGLRSGFPERTRCGGYSYGFDEDSPKFLELHEVLTKKLGGAKNEHKFQIDWTEQFNAINKILNKDEKLTEWEKTRFIKTLRDFNIIKK